MLLTTANLYYYLRDRDLLPAAAEAVVAGDLWIVPQVRRNRTFRVIRRGGPGLFVKQVRAWTSDAIASLVAEAGWLTGFREDPALAPAAALAPRLQYYDPAGRVLVLELVEGQTLTAAAPTGIPAPTLAAHLGATLGALHHALAAERPENAALVDQPAAPRPWILTPPSPATVTSISPGQAHALAILHRYPAFLAGLAARAADWRPMTLVHGDLKSDNCLVAACGAGSDGAVIHFVDWEFAGWGDPAWDAGTLLGGWLAAWAASGPVPPAPALTLQPAAQAFWASYAAPWDDTIQARAALQARTTSYAAARLAQIAFEMLHEAQWMTPASVRLLQLSHNLLADPAAAGRDLLNLGEPVE
ncbi:MAG TPA: phosphotransferase [Chloroflexia bacterium]|nr:phosphotransferase [Chloroflexia bacterium]